jgi:hypothetical protein
MKKTSLRAVVDQVLVESARDRTLRRLVWGNGHGRIVNQLGRHQGDISRLGSYRRARLDEEEEQTSPE